MTSRVGRWVRAVVCWGGSYENEATPPASVNGAAGTASSIAAGANHACAIQAVPGRSSAGERTASAR